MLKRTEHYNQLLDFYEELLTEKQREILSLYYREDLSLSEISEHSQTSRASIHDLISRCEKKLDYYEKCLSLSSNYQKRKEIYDKILNGQYDDIGLEIKELLKIE